MKRTPADLVLIAIGIRLRLGLAQDAGITSRMAKPALRDHSRRAGTMVAAQNMVEPKSTGYAGTNPIQCLRCLGETQPTGGLLPLSEACFG